MKVGVYVGSFDPVHKGHERVVHYLLDKSYVDKVFVIPTGNYWNKQDLTRVDERVDMLKLVFSDDRVIVDSSFSKYQYTYQIMNELSNKFREDKFYLIIGADNIKDFHLWKNVEDILKNNVIIIPRDGIDVVSYIDRYKEKDKFVLVGHFESENISSTFIRKNILIDNLEVVKDVLDNRVLRYIISKGLYKGE